jgi:hypothetical protein
VPPGEVVDTEKTPLTPLVVVPITSAEGHVVVD